MLIVEQDVNQALAVADRFYCLLEGRISLWPARPAQLTKERHHRGLLRAVDRLDGSTDGGRRVTWVNADRAGHPAGRAVRAVRHRAVAGFGVMRFVNLAHGDIAILAAFVDVVAQRRRSTSTRWSRCVIVLPGAFVVGYAVAAAGVRPRRRRRSGVPDRRHVRAVDRHPERAAREVHGRHARPRRRRASRRESIKINDQISDRLAAADHVAVRGRRARRAGAVPQAHQDGPRVPGDVRRPRGGAADGHRRPPRLRRRDRHSRSATVALAGVLLGARSSFDPFVGPGPADLRVRGGHHRWARLAVGHARRRHHPGRRPGASAARSTRSGASWPGTPCSSPCSPSGRPGMFGKVPA